MSAATVPLARRAKKEARTNAWGATSSRQSSSAGASISAGTRVPRRPPSGALDESESSIAAVFARRAASVLHGYAGHSDAVAASTSDRLSGRRRWAAARLSAAFPQLASADRARGSGIQAPSRMRSAGAMCACGARCGTDIVPGVETSFVSARVGGPARSSSFPSVRLAKARDGFARSPSWRRRRQRSTDVAGAARCCQLLGFRLVHRSP